VFVPRCLLVSLTTLLTTAIVACSGAGGGTTPVAGGSSSTGVHTSPSPAASSSSTTTSSYTVYTCPQGAPTSSGTLDCTTLPLGDLKTSTTAKVGYIDACQTQSGQPVVSTAPWIDSSDDEWDALTKLAVEGSVSWPGSFSATVTSNGVTRTVTSNGLPISPYTTGTFPIQSSDPAYQYDHNPNSIAAQSIAYTFPANPTVAATPTCLGMGRIGVTLTGVSIYNGFDGADYDAVAREIQDQCHGHPDMSSTYHYHGFINACVPDSGSATTNSSLLGYAQDGFGIYGPWYNGKVLTTHDLDVCHGVTSPVMWNGTLTTIYHYVSTYDFPYTIGCYRGTPV
jgi:hypothetical protein